MRNKETFLKKYIELTLFDMEQRQTILYGIVQTMQKYGGSFVKKLAELIPLADESNLRKLILIFDDIFTKYYDIAEKEAVSYEELDEYSKKEN